MLLLGFGCAHLSPISYTYEHSAKALVNLRQSKSSCSGFHIGEGRILTAAHCLARMPKAEIILSDGRTYQHKLLLLDRQRDLAMLSIEVSDFEHLSLWDPFFDGKIPLGTEIISIGFPGYYSARIQFEVGHIHSIAKMDGVTVLISKNTAFPGESGGPVVATVNGKVVGVVHAYREVIRGDSSDKHYHIHLSYFIAYNEILNFLNQIS